MQRAQNTNGMKDNARGRSNTIKHMSRVATAMLCGLFVLLGLKSQAHAEKQKYYYCEFRAVFDATDYYSDVFQAPEVSWDGGKYPGAFLDYLKAHYTIGAVKDPPLCQGEDERGAAKQERDQNETRSKRLQRKIVETGWTY